MGSVVFKDQDGKDKSIEVDDNTEAIVLSNKELSKAIGRLAAAMIARGK